jgi:hypothetical protein
VVRRFESITLTQVDDHREHASARSRNVHFSISISISILDLDSIFERDLDPISIRRERRLPSGEGASLSKCHAGVTVVGRRRT